MSVACAAGTLRTALNAPVLAYQLAERPNLSNHITPLDGVHPNRTARNGGLANLCSSRLECQQRRDDVSDCNNSAVHVHLPQARTQVVCHEMKSKIVEC